MESLSVYSTLIFNALKTFGIFAIIGLILLLIISLIFKRENNDTESIYKSRCLELENAIRTHRDQHGDDRCWLDDRDLYAVLNEEQPDTSLPPREKFLANCARFYECRQASNNSYQGPQGKWITVDVLNQLDKLISQWQQSPTTEMFAKQLEKIIKK